MAFRRKIAELGLIGLLGFFVAREARASPVTNVTMNPVTNNASLTWNWADQYLIQATASSGGSVSGNTNAWIDSGSQAQLFANSFSNNTFAYFSVNNGQTLENITNTPLNPLEIIVDKPLNITATFLENPNFYLSIRRNTNNQAELQIDNTSPDWEYGINSRTNLIAGEWNELIPHTRGNNINLTFTTNFNSNVEEFYNGKAKPYVP